MLSKILADLRSYCEQMGESPLLLEVKLCSGRAIVHPFPAPELPARRAGAGYRSVVWDGAEYSFTPLQAAAVAVLWEAWQAGTPDVGGQLVLRRIDSDRPYLRCVFEGHPAWGKLIVAGSGRGMYRLAVGEAAS